MKEFDYIIIGGGCAGLSLAYELEIHRKFENKTLAIIEPRSRCFSIKVTLWFLALSLNAAAIPPNPEPITIDFIWLIYSLLKKM